MEKTLSGSDEGDSTNCDGMNFARGAMKAGAAYLCRTDPGYGVAEMLTSFTVGGKDLGNIGNAAVASSVSAPVTAFCRSLAP